MRSNTPLMNSWHSFSPNGRWLVFSSKSRSPYTQMFLTHIDKDGNDSPPILIENATAANRAVNIPGFLNVPPDGLLKIDTPVTDFYRLADIAYDLAKKGRYEAAIEEWKKALELSPTDDKAHSNLGLLLAGVGRFGEAVPHFEETLKINPEYPEGHSNLASVLGKQGKAKHAIAAFRKVQEIDAGYPDVHQNLGRLLADAGSCNEAIAQLELALQASPASAEVHNGLAVCLVRERRVEQAVAHLRKALEINPDFAEAPLNLGDTLYFLQGNAPEALAHWRLEITNRTLANAVASGDTRLVETLRMKLALYQCSTPFRKSGPISGTAQAV